MAPAHPLALPPTTARALLDYTLTSTSYPTTVLICSSRAAFLASLLSSASSSSSLHPLTPTLHILSVSPHIQVIYTPTLSHLRAWLSIADDECAASAPTLRPGSKTSVETANNDDNGRNQLIVWGLVKMHKGTSEWSVQGLSSTTAALVDTGKRMERRLVLAEEAESEQGEKVSGGEDKSPRRHETIEDQEGLDEIGSLNEGSDPDSGDQVREIQRKQAGIFHKRLPMLNGSFRTDGNSLEAETWSGRAVEVGIVLKRWFRFTGEEILH